MHTRRLYLSEKGTLVKQMPISYIRLRVKLSPQPAYREAVLRESIGFCHMSIAEVPGLGKTVLQGLSVPGLMTLKDSCGLKLCKGYLQSEYE